MRAKLIAVIISVATAIVSPVFGQNEGTNETKTEDKLILDLSGLDWLLEVMVIKLEDNSFRVEDIEGIDITEDMIALKTPNNLDLLFYDIETGFTSLCYEFYNTETKINEWLDCVLLPESPTGLYWVLSNDFKNFYIIQNGSYLQMDNFQLKANPANKNEYIVQEDGIDKYVMKELKGKSLDEFYPLELIK